MKQIELSQGQFALVDDADYEDLARFCWYSFERNGRCYGERIVSKRPVVRESMQGRIMGIGPAGLIIDHADRNPLNNQRYNLRWATTSQNVANSSRRLNASGFRGVYLAAGRFDARICVNNRLRYLGRFATADEAARARDKAALEAFGEFAVLNFPAAVT